MVSKPILMLVVALLAVSTAPAFAKGKDHVHASDNHHGNPSDDVTVAFTFGDADRARITSYLRQDYHRACPPGLAKKRNGCLPPGQAKKYAVGGYLPAGIIFTPVPSDLLAILGPPPRGTIYAQVDKDILLMTEAGHKILDAVTLLSAVN